MSLSSPHQPVPSHFSPLPNHLSFSNLWEETRVPCSYVGSIFPQTVMEWCHIFHQNISYLPLCPFPLPPPKSSLPLSIPELPLSSRTFSLQLLWILTYPDNLNTIFVLSVSHTHTHTHKFPWLLFKLFNKPELLSVYLKRENYFPILTINMCKVCSNQLKFLIFFRFIVFIPNNNVVLLFLFIYIYSNLCYLPRPVLSFPSCMKTS